jgi:polyisoprenoid-binding protein YceI
MRLIVAALAAAIFSAGAAETARAAGYTMDAQQSRLEFVGVQAGADFKGAFRKFTVAVEFSPDALASSLIDVQVDMNSVDSMDKDRDTTIRGKDVFDIAHFPSAHYVTKSIAKSAAGFTAIGSLTLHGVTKEVPIDFQFLPMAGAAKLEGSAKLKRLDFGVGQGDWKSTEWVSDAVKISFSLVLKPKS